MGFLSFNEKYYTEALKRLKGRPLGKARTISFGCPCMRRWKGTFLTTGIFPHFASRAFGRCCLDIPFWKELCRGYEQIRSFETLYAQDALMKFSSFRDGRFYVKTAADDGIWERAADEVAALQGGKLNIEVKG